MGVKRPRATTKKEPFEQAFAGFFPEGAFDVNAIDSVVVQEKDAFAFADDHLYAFFTDGKPWSQNAYWDKEDGKQPSADKAVLKKLELEQGTRFLYLFDFGDEWKFTIQLEEILDAPAPFKPIVIEKKGKDPEEYPDWD